MSEKKDKYGVPVEVPHYHEPNPSAGLSEEAARQLDLAMWEMNSDVVVDESAAPTFD
jgi:hypothetical protein